VFRKALLRKLTLTQSEGVKAVALILGTALMAGCVSEQPLHNKLSINGKEIPPVPMQVIIDDTQRFNDAYKAGLITDDFAFPGRLSKEGLEKLKEQ